MDSTFIKLTAALLALLLAGALVVSVVPPTDTDGIHEGPDGFPVQGTNVAEPQEPPVESLGDDNNVILDDGAPF